MVTIKKYANRRLYNTESSTYITLEHLAEMVRQKRDFRVVDAKSGDDITHNVLTQIIMEQEARGTNMLPVSFLRQLISLYGDSMQSMVPQFLEESMGAFQRNQEQVRSAMTGAFSAGPFAEMVKRNMELFAAASGNRGASPNAAATPESPSSQADATKDEIAELRAQLASLQKKIDQLGE